MRKGKPRIWEIRPQLARDLRAVSKHFGLSPASELVALEAAQSSVHKAARIYRAIAASLR